MRGFKSWITERHPVAARFFQLERREIGEVRTRNTSSVCRSDIRAPVNVVLDLNARQEIRVGLFSRNLDIRGDERSTGVEFRKSSYKRCLGTLDAQPTQHLKVPDRDRVLNVAGDDAFSGDVIVGV